MLNSTAKWVTRSVKRGYQAIADIHKAIDGKAMIAGGYAAWMVSPMPKPRTPSDVDIFCIGANQNVKDILIRIGAELRTTRGPVLSMAYQDLKLQVIAPLPTWQVWPDDLLNSFDMDTCQAVLINQDVCMGSRRMGANFPIIRRVGDPLYAMRRVMKYNRGGVDFDGSEIERIMVAYQHDQTAGTMLPPFQPSVTRIPREELDFWLAEEDRTDEYD